jgi:hypothetical protein
MAARSRIAACLCVLACALAAGATAAPSTSTPPGPHFRPASGWLIVKPTATEQPVSWRSMIVAVTTHDAAAAHPFLVFTSLTRLSKRGILIWAMTIGRNRPTFMAMAWPPRLSSFRVDHGWEGQPAPNVQQRLRWGVIDGWDMDVRVYFATQHPDAQLLHEAQAQLDRLVLPSR